MNFNSKQQKPKLYFNANFIILFKKYQIKVTPDARHLTSFSSESVSLLIHFFLTNTEILLHYHPQSAHYHSCGILLLLFLHLTEDSTSVEPSKRSSLEVEQWHQEHGRPLQLLLLHVAHHPTVVLHLLCRPAIFPRPLHHPGVVLRPHHRPVVLQGHYPFLPMLKYQNKLENTEIKIKVLKL